MYDDSGKIIQQWFGGGQFNAILFGAKKMQDTFIKRVKPLTTNTIGVLSNIRSNAMPYF
jgi:hypothetical protein